MLPTIGAGRIHFKKMISLFTLLWLRTQNPYPFVEMTEKGKEKAPQDFYILGSLIQFNQL